MADPKTKPTPVNPEAFIEAVENTRRREDATAVRDLFAEVTGEPAVMWGPSIVGFGRYAYTYDSGHSGETMVLGLSPRAANLVLYMNRAFDGADDLVARLGKVKEGKGCLYIARLDGVDLAVLRDLAARSVAWTRSTYGPPS